MCNDGANCSERGYLERCGFDSGFVEMVTEDFLETRVIQKEKHEIQSL